MLAHQIHTRKSTLKPKVISMYEYFTPWLNLIYVLGHIHWKSHAFDHCADSVNGNNILCSYLFNPKALSIYEYFHVLGLL